MTELHHFHPARKGSGSLRPFPIYPLYTQTVILSLDKPIADCFLFRPRKRLEKRRKRSHTNVSNALATRTSRPPAQTAHVRFKGMQRVHTPPVPLTAHTAAYTAKQGAFRVGVVSLPSERFTRFGNPAWPGIRTANFAAFGPWSGALPKNAESLRNSDALMRVAVPRRRGPAGLRDPCRLLYCTGKPQGFVIAAIKDRELCWRGCLAFACDAGDSSLVTAVRFWSRCLHRSTRGTYPSEQRSGCQS